MDTIISILTDNELTFGATSVQLGYYVTRMVKSVVERQETTNGDRHSISGSDTGTPAKKRKIVDV